MKKLYFLLLTLLISSVTFGQGSIDFDTEANWNTTSGSYGDWEYADAGTNFLAVGISILRNGTADQDGFPGGFGLNSVRLRNNATSSLTMTISSGGIGDFSFQVRRWDGNPATNFSVETTTDGTNWSPSSTIDATVTTDSDWKTVNGTINSPSSSVGVRIISNGTTERIMVDNFTWTGFSTSCGVAFGTASTVCNANTVGDNNDSVTINIPYTGSDAAITDVTTTSGGTVGGDDPSSVANGTITITGLLEGAAWDVALVGGDCGALSASGSVAAAYCDPIPNTCFDLSTGMELFEIVTVAANSDMDVWTESSGTYSINGYCGSGCMEESNGWLVFGPLDMSGVTDLGLLFDAAEGFDGSTLDIQYTSDYSGLCPDAATWTSVQTISDAGLGYSVDLSAATGTNVFVGVQYLDSDGTFSSWTLSNVSLAAFGSCPTLGARPTSDCATCDLTLQTETYTCATNTDGDNNDNVTINIPYSGSESTIGTVTTTSGGMVVGDDPATVADGTIMITGLSEGDAWDLTINGGDCDGTTISGTVPAAQCDPEILVINEINADPSNAPGEVGDANGDGTAHFSDDEFVEIYNTGAVAIDMENYTLEDASLRHTFPAGTILQPNSFITVFGGGVPTGIPGIAQIATTGSVGLSNGGDTVTLKDDNGVVLTSYTYTGAGNNQSIGRNPDFTGPFVQHATIDGNGALFSPGIENDDPTLSNEQFTSTVFTLYPNPTNTGFVNITSSNSDAMNVQVFDILGKRVKNETLTNSTLDVSNLNTGLYIVKITQNDASVTKKLVIK
ncbi:lamin tail domain-containing protein [Winogradskyella sp.]|uniref:T9SS type A sorting domain-containing protein n=1 Tax=Winogradskyella sp. TaxID=1883156 RepID=UPI0025DED604|nr:lamin tail domain-containing protein [Winogradskyella sp.]